MTPKENIIEFFNTIPQLAKEKVPKEIIEDQVTEKISEINENFPHDKWKFKEFYICINSVSSLNGRVIMNLLMALSPIQNTFTHESFANFDVFKILYSLRHITMPISNSDEDRVLKHLFQLIYEYLDNSRYLKPSNEQLSRAFLSCKSKDFNAIEIRRVFGQLNAILSTQQLYFNSREVCNILYGISDITDHNSILAVLSSLNNKTELNQSMNRGEIAYALHSVKNFTGITHPFIPKLTSWIIESKCTLSDENFYFAIQGMKNHTNTPDIESLLKAFLLKIRKYPSNHIDSRIVDTIYSLQNMTYFRELSTIISMLDSYTRSSNTISFVEIQKIVIGLRRMSTEDSIIPIYKNLTIKINEIEGLIPTHYQLEFLQAFTYMSPLKQEIPSLVHALKTKFNKNFEEDSTDLSLIINFFHSSAIRISPIMEQLFDYYCQISKNHRMSLPPIYQTIYEPSKYRVPSPRNRERIPQLGYNKSSYYNPFYFRVEDRQNDDEKLNSTIIYPNYKRS